MPAPTCSFVAVPILDLPALPCSRPAAFSLKHLPNSPYPDEPLLLACADHREDVRAQMRHYDGLGHPRDSWEAFAFDLRQAKHLSTGEVGILSFLPDPLCGIESSNTTDQAHADCPLCLGPEVQTRIAAYRVEHPIITRETGTVIDSREGTVIEDDSKRRQREESERVAAEVPVTAGVKLARVKAVADAGPQAEADPCEVLASVAAGLPYLSQADRANLEALIGIIRARDTFRADEMARAVVEISALHAEKLAEFPPAGTVKVQISGPGTDVQHLFAYPEDWSPRQIAAWVTRVAEVARDARPPTKLEIEGENHRKGACPCCYQPYTLVDTLLGALNPKISEPLIERAYAAYVGTNAAPVPAPVALEATPPAAKVARCRAAALTGSASQCTNPARSGSTVGFCADCERRSAMSLRADMLEVMMDAPPLAGTVNRCRAQAKSGGGQCPNPSLPGQHFYCAECERRGAPPVAEFLVQPTMVLPPVVPETRAPSGDPWCKCAEPQPHGDRSECWKCGYPVRSVNAPKRRW